MIFLVQHPLKRPAEKQFDLLITVLDMFGIEYQHTTADNIPAGSLVITDCFVMETPSGDPGHDIAVKLIETCTGRDCRIIFYYPSESYATLSASFCITGQRLVENSITGYLIKCGDWPIPGYAKNYDIPEFFAWIIYNTFNRARLAYTCDAIDIQVKTHKFLFLNGAQRTNRDYFFDLYKKAGLLDSSIWSYRGGKSAIGHGPREDWPDPFVHPDFRFYAYYPAHFYRTQVSVVSETTQNEFFPTEKTYKSLMLGHPFVLYGHCGSLDKLKRLGFLTFDPYIDESYDRAAYPLERADMMIPVLQKIPDDIMQLTKEQRWHNRKHFATVAESVYFRLLNILREIDRECIINESFCVDQSLLDRYFLN